MQIKHIIAANPADMARKAANMIAAQVLMKPKCVLGLATGSTPIGVYAELIRRCREGDISFRDVTSVNLDEYCNIPAFSKNSYRCYMEENLFTGIDIAPPSTFLPDGMAADFDEECRRYTELIDRMGGIDLQLLGIGMNGHIGFNEPADVFTMDTYRVALSKSTREANAVHFEDGMEGMPTHALTMGMRPIMQARRIVLVAGANKKDILEEALCGPVTPRVPASILQLHPRLSVVYSET